MKMNLDEFHTRLKEVAGREQAVAITSNEKVIGHYLPVTHRDPEHLDIEGWATAQLAARARWIARTPDWQERLRRFGLDEDGEPYENEPRP